MSEPHPYGTRFLVKFDKEKVSSKDVVKKLRGMGSHIVESKPAMVEMVLPPGKEDELTKMVIEGNVEVEPAGARLDPKEWNPE